eukprot:755320-Hanusia_phi.AAC.2
MDIAEKWEEDPTLQGYANSVKLQNEIGGLSYLKYQSMSGEESLPPGWSKHWSNTWKKHYWFNSKTGEQSWEPPRLGQGRCCKSIVTNKYACSETPSEEPKAKETPHEDKPDESVKKKPKTDGSGTNPPKTKQPSQAKNANSKVKTILLESHSNFHCLQDSLDSKYFAVARLLSEHRVLDREVGVRRWERWGPF